MNEEIISGVVKLYNKLAEDFEIDLFLHENSVPMVKFPEIKKEAKARSLEERLQTFPRKFKIRFAIWVAITILAFYFFYVVLPYANLFHFKLILSILGGVSLSVLLIAVWAHYKSWTPKSIEEGFKFRLNGIVLVIIILPAAILAGINWFCFDAAETNLLSKYHEEAIGTVVAGQSIKSRRADFTSVTVQFRTKEGKEIIATESVPAGRFDTYYKGQKLNVVYYTGDPTIISILQSDSEIKEILGTEERDLNPKDLIHILEMKSDSTQEILSKISQGWAFDSETKAFVNERKEQALQYELGYLTYVNASAMQVFPKLLEEMGFKLIEEQNVKGIVDRMKTYENDSYTFIIEMQVVNQAPLFVTSVMKKEQ